MCRKSNKSNQITITSSCPPYLCHSLLFRTLCWQLCHPKGSDQQWVCSSSVASVLDRDMSRALFTSRGLCFRRQLNSQTLMDPHNPSAYLISRTFFLLSTMFLSRSSLSALFVFAVFGSANASCPSGNDPNCAWGEEDLLL